MLVVGGSGSNGIDEKVAKLLRAEYVRLAIHQFPDGEYKITVPREVNGEDILIVQSTYNPQDRHIFELLLIADLLKDMGAVRLGAVIPYLAFARQDKRFADGESVSVKTILNLLNSVGIDYLLVVQPHKKEPLSSFKGKTDIIEPAGMLMDLVKGYVKDPFVLAPDKSGLSLAKAAAGILHCDCTYLDKERDHETGAVSIKNSPDVDFRGKDVIIVDDMISTGGTIVIAADFAYSRGARKVFAAAVHLLMAGDAAEKLRKAKVERIFGVNTVPCRGAELMDISGEIARAVKRSYQK